MPMTNILRRCALILAAAAMAGCATVMPANPADRDPDAGEIIFYRPMSGFGYAMRADIFVDGLLVARSVPGERFTARARPGKHVVSVPNAMYGGDRKLEVDVRPRETVHVRTSIGGAAFAGRFDVELVPAAEAAGELAVLGQVKPIGAARQF